MPKDSRIYRGYGRRRYGGKILFILCLVVAALAIGVAAFFILRERTGDSFGDVPLGSGFDKAAVAGTLSEQGAGDLSPASEFHYRINQKITVAKGKANLRIENPPENQQLLKVNILLSEGTEIYATEWIKPYHCIESDRLDSTPKKGSYSAVAKISAYDSVSKELLSTVEQPLTVTVQ